MILCKLFVKESVYLCNYKNHADIDRNWKEERGWKRKDSPEYFFYVGNRVDAINDIRKVMEIKNGSTQVTLIMLWGIRRYNIGSGTHFVLETPDEIVNPDENIDIKNLKYTIQGVAIRLYSLLRYTVSWRPW